VSDYNTFLTSIVQPKEADVGTQITEIEQVKNNIKLNKEGQQDVE
jgi:hypothetical protein